MALTHLRPILLMTLLAAACTASPSPPGPAEEAGEEMDALDVTRWTGTTELFAEYPPLAVGQTSRFAIHLTWLDSFKAVTEGTVEVHLSGGGPPEVFRAAGPSRRRRWTWPGRSATR